MAEEKIKENEGEKPDPAKELESSKAKITDLEAQIAKLMKKPDDKQEQDLNERVKKQKESDDQKAADTKVLESALTFSMKSQDFLKTNESLLPKEVANIFKEADKENYSSAVEKAAAIKSGIVQSFFSVQANVDLLTPWAKSQLDEYLKLTKNGKQEKAQQIYETVFEPSFEMLKRLKKAEALNKGFGSSGDADTAYKNRLMSLSRKHYLGEKTNA